MKSRLALLIVSALLWGGVTVAEAQPERKPFIIVDKRGLTLYYYNASGNVAKTYPIACGEYLGNKRDSGDRRTPEGTFTINKILYSRHFSHDFGDGKGLIRGAYGPWFFGLDVPGVEGIAIHGTHLPESIGTRSTEGCIRLKNEDIQELRHKVFKGMIVIILPDYK